MLPRARLMLRLSTRRRKKLPRARRLPARSPRRRNPLSRLSPRLTSLSRLAKCLPTMR
jgi:hypothetical protein